MISMDLTQALVRKAYRSSTGYWGLVNYCQRYRSCTFHGRRSAAEQWRILELYNDITRQAAAAHDIPLIDLARMMPKDTKYYFDWVHYSLEGAEAVADVIGNDLIRILSK